jgi:prepilin-type N-terminal cleavage/methylation domain-containing protein
MNKKGFTLIELLIVIVIIGVLAGLIISVLRNTDSAKEANVARSMHRLRLLAEEMKNTSGDYKNLSLAEEIYN